MILVRRTTTTLLLGYPARQRGITMVRSRTHLQRTVSLMTFKIPEVFSVGD